MKKKIFAVLALAFLLALSMAPAAWSAVVDSGECGAEGDNVTWVLDDTNTLTISGTGVMADYTYTKNTEHPPYDAYLGQINKIIIEDGVTHIGNSAFSGCIGLNSITIPDSVTGIGSLAFSNCSNLEEIEIPDSVTEIGDRVFAGCSNLYNSIYEKIKFTGDNPNFVVDYGENDVVLFNKEKTRLIQYLYCYDYLGSYTIPDSVTEVADYAFYDISLLANVNIPDSVNIIGKYAFYNCEDLRTIIIPKKVTKIEEFTFSGCSSLTNVTLPDGLIYIGSYAFGSCRKLSETTIPDSVTTISDSAFSGCSSLTKIVIPSSVTSIGQHAFGFCSSLADVKLPGSLTSLDSTFTSCEGLTKISIPEGIDVIDYSAFYNCTNLKEITLPVSLKQVSSFAFQNCSSLTDVYYAGTEAEWQNVKIDDYGNYNAPFINANFHYNYSDKPANIPVTGISMQPSNTTTLGKEGDLTYFVNFEPKNATNKNIIWECDKPDIITIDKNGHYVTKNAGVVTITAKTEDGGFTAQHTLKVKPYIKDITLDKTDLTLTVNAATQLKATLSPTGVIYEDIIWKTSDGRVATVDQTGNVKAFSTGTAIITVDADGRTATCTVKVIANDVKPGAVPVTDLILDIRNLDLFVGGSAQINAKVYPASATNQKVTYASNNENVATVDADGNVKAVGVGYATIIANSEEGSYKGFCTVKVTANDDDNPGSDPEKPTTPGGDDKPGNNPEKPTTPGGDDVKPGAVPVTDLYFDVKNINLIVGEDKQVKANVYPANATNQKVTYVSSDKKVATVDANGTVKATGAGKATITATSEEGAYKATYTVNVIDSDVKITLDKKQLDMIVGKRNSNGMLINPRTIPVKAEVSGNVENKRIVWTSDNYDVGSVDNHTSEAFAKGEGKATITAALADYPSIKATLIINAVKDENANFIYNIGFDANGGVLKCADVIQVARDKEFIMPTAEMKGYKLQYWEDKKDASKTYAANNAYAFSADTDLKAVWQQDTSSKPSSGGSHSGGNRKPSGSAGGATAPTKPEQPTKPGTTEKPGTSTNQPSGTVTALNIHNVFADVKNGEWYSEAVAYVYNKGMMNGTEKGFEPNASTTRAMLVTMLYRLEGEPNTGNANFSDVASGQWFSKAIAWASANGVVTGYENGTFGPNDAITREQLVAVLYRYAQTKGLDVSVKGSLSNFSDSGKVSGWAQEAMQWAVGAGIISGDNGALKPQGNATRAEVAMMLMRYLEK